MKFVAVLLVCLGAASATALPDLCEACLNATQKAEAYVSSSQFLDTTKIVLEFGCLSSNDVSECKGVADQVAEQLQANLTEQFSGNSLCVQLQLCNASEAQIMETFEQLAGKLAMQIAEGLCSGNEDCIEKVSGLAGHWMKDLESVAENFRAGPPEFVCEACLNATKKAEAYVSSSQFLDTTKIALEAGCLSCPKVSKCRAAVDKVAEEIQANVTKVFSGNALCVNMRLCNASEAQVMQVLEQFAGKFAMQVAEDFCDGNDACVKKVSGLAGTWMNDLASVSAGFTSGPPQIVCDACVNATKQVKEYVSSKQFIDTTEILLEMSCLGSRDVSACKQVADKISQQLQANLTQEFSGNALCVKWNLCNETKVHVLRVIEQLTGQVVEKVSSELCEGREQCIEKINELAGLWMDDMHDIGLRNQFAPEMTMRWTTGDLYNNLCGYDCCDQCQNVASKLKDYFSGGRTNRLIYLILSAPCAFLPGREACRTTAQNRVDSFFGRITSNLDEANFCKRLPCCGKSFGTITLPKADCIICRVEAAVMRRAITNGASQEEYTKDALAVCEKLPTFPFDLKDNCTDFVNNRIDQLYPAVQSSPNNTVACESIGFCNTAESNLFGCTGEPIDACTTCNEAVESFHSNVNDFNNGVFSVFNNICNNLGPFSGPCVSLTQSTVPRIITRIQTFFSGPRVCGAVKFC